MDDKNVWLGAIAIICFIVGLAQIIKPQAFAKTKKSTYWFAWFDLWGILLRSDEAKNAARANGVILLFVAAILGSYAFGLWNPAQPERGALLETPPQRLQHPNV